MANRDELAEYVRDFLTGGDGYMLDCFLQEPSYQTEIENVTANRLFEISHKYTSTEYPIGIANPEAEKELWDVVRILEDTP